MATFRVAPNMEPLPNEARGRLVPGEHERGCGKVIQAEVREVAQIADLIREIDLRS